MNEEAAARDYLIDYLGSDAELQGMVSGVWGAIPQSAPMPAVKIEVMERSDLMVIGLHRVWDDLAFLVRAIVHWRGGGQPDWTEVRAIGDRIDALLHDHEAITSELQVHSFREESFTDETVEQGDLFLSVGGIYRLRARSV